VTAYAGIGARKTPAPILDVMRALAYRLGEGPYELRTGGAPGADQAFYGGGMQAGGDVALYLPWASYERYALARWGQPRLKLDRPAREAYAIAQQHHPGWARLSSGVRSLMARNVHQILGSTLREPSRFVVCWTPDGSLDGASRESGGTGMALRLAHATGGIEVFNLARPDHLQRIQTFTGLTA
jgi:hypothetical protein